MKLPLIPLLILALTTAIHAASHPPLRPLPTASSRPMPAGPVRFVDAQKGDDTADGSEKKPWKTINHALGLLKSGDTLCLRGGVYFEQVTVALSGSPEKPITIRSHPGELAVIDGGLREFFEKPADAWEPVAGGAKGEYRSKRLHPNLRDVMGAFGDSRIGLHAYHNAIDLRTDNEWWDPQNPDDKTSDVKPVYCGPGVWYDRADGRIYVRLQPTHVPEIENYTGESDPRKLPLLIAPYRALPLHVDGASHVRFQDLEIRGGGYDTVMLDQSRDVDFENVTIYASTYGVRATGMERLKMDHCALVGSVPPWCFRTDTSLRSYGERSRRDITRFGTHALIVQEAGREYSVFAYPINDDWEIAHCDFTGAHDGLYLGGINVRFHHNRIWGTQDDGIYLSPMYQRMGKAKPCELHIYQNVFSGCLTTLAFGGAEILNKDKVFVYRNIFDLRSPVKTGRPSSGDGKTRFSTGGMIGDHGSPPWSAATIYHNTFIMAERARSADMTLLGASSPERPRRLFNNIMLHLDKLPALLVTNDQQDAQGEGNLYWQPGLTAEAAAGLLKPKQRGTATGKVETNFLAADPAFVRADADPKAPNDYRLKPGSPAIDAGVELPADLPDPLRAQDKGKPDLGALPFGAEPLHTSR